MAVVVSLLAVSAAAQPLRIGVVGLVHGHVEGLLWNAREREDLEIVGVYETDTALFDRMAEKYGLDPSLRYDNLDRMLDATKPEAVSVMTSTKGHLRAIEACAPRGIPALVEKPLATTTEDAERIAALSRGHGVLVLTNYETSWYASVHESYRLTREGERYAPIRRAVFRHGHKGPVEIGCSAEFLAWLTDPKENGGGALFDFGCYGVNIMTWLMGGEVPQAVTASVSTLKPERYPRVDDDATIVLSYPSATAVVQASWAWTHDNKEMDLHTEGGSIHAGKWDELRFRLPDGPFATGAPPARRHPYGNEWSYLKAVVRGECEVDPLSSLENNVIVVRVLDAARRSAAVGGRAVKP